MVEKCCNEISVKSDVNGKACNSERNFKCESFVTSSISKRQRGKDCDERLQCETNSGSVETGKPITSSQLKRNDDKWN